MERFKRFLNSDWLLVSFGIFMGSIGVILFIYLFGLPSAINFGVAEFTLSGFEPEVVEVTRITEVEVTRLVEVVKELETSMPINDNPTATAMITSSDSLSDRLTPSPTINSIYNIQSPGFVFADDFERGPDPAWDILYGTPGMSNGKYTVITEFDGKSRRHGAIVGEQYWANVAITVDVAPLDRPFLHACDLYGGCPSWGIGAILLRQQTNAFDVGVLLLPFDNGLAIATFDEEGNYTIQSGSLVSGRDENFNLFDGVNTIRAEAIENTYIVYLDDRQITSATVPGPTEGHVGLWFQNSDMDNKVEAFATRIESFHAESLP